MAVYYVNSLDGNNGNTGGEGDQWQTIPYALTQMGTNDTLVVEYAGGTAYPITAVQTLGASLSGIRFTAADSEGTRWDQNPLTVNRAQRPIIDCNGVSLKAFEQTDAAEQRWYGLRFKGDNVATEAIAVTASGATTWIEGCSFTDDFIVRALRFKSGTIRECWFEGVTSEAMDIVGPSTDPNIEACVFLGNTGLAIEKDLTANVNLRNCTFINNGTGTYCLQFADEFTIENCLFVDNLTTYGLPAGEQVTGNCYTSDAGTYHTSGNYNGAPTANDLQLDPQFFDEVGKDFRLGNATLALGGTANSVPRLYDGTPMPATPPIGALPSSDQTPPVITINEVAAGTYLTTRSASFTFTGSADESLGNAFVEVNGGAAIALELAAVPTTFVLADPVTLQPGRNEFKVTAADFLENTTTVWFAVVLEAPDISDRSNRLLGMFPKSMRGNR